VIKIMKKILLISGPCASGKTTLGNILASQYGYIHIDGDPVWNQLKQKDKDIHWNDIHADIMRRSIEYGHSNVVITHLVPPGVIPQYEVFYNKHDVSFDLIILLPPLETLIQRNKTRTCWENPTPDDVINKYYNIFIGAKNEYGHYFVNNSKLTPKETIKQYLT
jgi:tRNA uridine 5-carbamoylmethylation protein Kti12